MAAAAHVSRNFLLCIFTNATDRTPCCQLGENGVRAEWHLLKLFGMTMFADVRSGEDTRLGE